jgi:hypothetical protein
MGSPFQESQRKTVHFQYTRIIIQGIQEEEQEASLGITMEVPDLG